jgi:hypothetical protein
MVDEGSFVEDDAIHLYAVLLFFFREIKWSNLCYRLALSSKTILTHARKLHEKDSKYKGVYVFDFVFVFVVGHNFHNKKNTKVKIKYLYLYL